jgi:glutamyl-tRNA synthetase
MSKRDTGASLTHYMENGYAAEAVVNYLCLLGWSPKQNREKMLLSEIVESFDLLQILRHNARFDMEKLNWLNGEYVREMVDDRFYEMSVHALARTGIDTNKFPLGYVKAALDTCKGKFRTFGELPTYGGFYFTESIPEDGEAARQHFTAENKPRLQRLRDALAALEPFEPDPIGETFKSIAKELGVKTAVLVHPARLALTGSTSGPSLYHLIAILGRTKCLARLDAGLARAG